MARYVYRLLDITNSVTNTLISQRPARLFLVTGYNAAAATRFLKLFDKATAPAAGTDTPIWTEPMKTVDVTRLYFGSGGLSFQTGFGFAVTNLNADSDTTAPTAHDLLGLNFLYEVN